MKYIIYEDLSFCGRRLSFEKRNERRLEFAVYDNFLGEGDGGCYQLKLDVISGKRCEL